LSTPSYKINRTLAIDKIKRQTGRWLLTVSTTARRLKPILEEIALNLQKFVLDRKRLSLKRVCLMLTSRHDKKLNCENCSALYPVAIADNVPFAVILALEMP
jgi:hypothetical protein